MASRDIVSCIIALINQLKFIDEYVGIALPCPSATNLVNEGCVGFAWRINENTIHRFFPSCEYEAEYVSTRGYFYSLRKTILVRYILQAFDTDASDADMMWHQNWTDKHLVVPAWGLLQFLNTLLRQLWELGYVLVCLRYCHYFIDSISRPDSLVGELRQDTLSPIRVC